jgi:hypothetical protein
LLDQLVSLLLGQVIENRSHMPAISTINRLSDCDLYRLLLCPGVEVGLVECIDITDRVGSKNWNSL